MAESNLPHELIKTAKDSTLTAAKILAKSTGVEAFLNPRVQEDANDPNPPEGSELSSPMFAAGSAMIQFLSPVFSELTVGNNSIRSRINPTSLTPAENRRMGTILFGASITELAFNLTRTLLLRHNPELMMASHIGYNMFINGVMETTNIVPALIKKIRK